MGKSSGRKNKSTKNPTPTLTHQDPLPPPPPPPTNGTATTTANGTAAADLDSSLFLKQAHDLKEEGNRLFQSKDYAAALQSYEWALRLLPRDHPDRAVFHSNRAACLMQMRPVDHHAVAAECSLALQAQPNFPRALLRRARALDALRHYDLSLKDVNSLLAVDPTNRDAIDLANKIRESIAVAAASQQQQQNHHHQQNHHQQQQQVNPSPAALGASAVRGAPISGLGPCLPPRPVPKKSTSPPPVRKLEKAPLSPHVNPSSNSNSNANLGSGPLPNGLPEVVLKPVKQAAATASVKLAAPQPVRVTTKWRPLKLVYDHDIRLAQIQANCSFKTLRETVAKRFPSSKAVLVKYKDEDGDLVTVTSTAELRLAEMSVDQARTEGGDVSKEETLSVLRLHVVEVSPEQEPQVPEEEVEEKPEEDEGLVKGDESLSHLSTGDDSVSQGLENDIMKTRLEEEAIQLKEKDAEKECDHAECKEVEIDDWLYDFAQLFRQQVGIDPDAHLDLHELGMELCSEALEESVTSEEAQSLFEMAAAKFQEVAALAFFNWGNAHMCAARKKMPLDETSPKEIMAAQLCVAYDWVRERYALAGEKYEEALRIKPDFYEGLLALGQQHFETAKLHWSFALANKVDLTKWDSSETIKLFDSAEQKMKSATEMWEKVEEQRINELKDPNLSKNEELLKKRKKLGVVADGQAELSAGEAAEQANVMRSQIHLFWGNMLFERSQVEFKLGVGDWKKNLDTAVERFKLAGASEADISAVLKNHASCRDGTIMECDEKKITSLSNDASETSANGEDKHVVEN